MQRFGVWGDDSISQIIAAGLSACGIPFLQVGFRETRRELGEALLVVPPKAQTAWDAPPEQVRYLLLPGDGAWSGVQADCAVSYGFHPRNSITLSSLEEDQMILSLQRELVTLAGPVLERQELCLSRPTQLGMEQALSICGALLMLGVSPEALDSAVQTVF